jgi:glycosyltransferase involved in cell wall biosynthesis
VFTTQHAANLYREVYSITECPKIVVIENGFNEDIFTLVDEELLFQRAQENETFSLLHSGELYGGRDPSLLFQAIKNLQRTHLDFPNFELVFRGASDAQHYSNVVQDLNIDPLVRFLPKQSYHGSIEEMLSSKALLLLQSELFNNQVPGKVYEYLRARKPILALTKPGSATASLLAGVEHAVVADIDSADEIADALAKILSVNVEPDFNSDRYNRFSRTEMLASVLDRLVAE